MATTAPERPAPPPAPTSPPLGAVGPVADDRTATPATPAAARRRGGLRRRLMLTFSGLAVLVLLAAAIGMLGLADQRTLAYRLGQAQDAAQLADQAEFHIADATGWQALYVADVAVFGPEVGLAPDSANRTGMAESEKRVYAWLDGLDTSAMSPDVAAAFEEMRPAWDAFFHWDAQVEQWLASGTPDGLESAMTSINDGEAGAAYGVVMDLASTAKELATAEVAAVEADRVAAEERSGVYLLITAVIAFGLRIQSGIRSSCRTSCGLGGFVWRRQPYHRMRPAPF